MLRAIAVLVVVMACCHTARAVNPAVWTIAESIPASASEVTWRSPTAIDTGLANYAYEYEITEARARFPIGSTDLLPLLGEQTAGSGFGSLPAVIIDETISETLGGLTVSADLFVEVGADGFANALIDNISLPPLVTRVDLTASVMITGYGTGDYSLDRSLDQSDYQAWRDAYGQTGEGLPADGNRDGVVDAADYTIWRDRVDGPSRALAAHAPEPAACWLLGVVLAGAATARSGSLPRPLPAIGRTHR